MVTQCDALSGQGLKESGIGLAVRTFAGMVGVAAALTLGGCSSFDWDSFKRPDLSIFAPRSVSAVRQVELKPVTAEDLVDADGRCAAPVASQEVAADGTTTTMAVPLIPSGIALDMTECDVVKRAGQPERVQVGTNERNERTLILTYIRGERPGIYNFVSGRLTSMERGPEPPAPVKKAKPKAKPKPKAT